MAGRFPTLPRTTVALILGVVSALVVAGVGFAIVRPGPGATEGRILAAPGRCEDTRSR